MAESFTRSSTNRMHFVFNFCLAASQRMRAATPPPWEGRTLTTVGGCVLALGLLCDAYLAHRFVYSKTAVRGGHFLKIETKPWGIPELLLVSAALLFVFLLSNSVYAIAAWVTHRTLGQLMRFVVTTEVFLRIGILAVFADLFRRRNLTLSSAFGLRALPPLAAIGWGITFGLASMPPVQLLIAATDELCHWLGLKPSEQPIAELFTATDSHLLLSLLVVFALAIAPVFEEVFFRGFAYPALKQRFGTWRAVLIVSAAFALSHSHLPSFVPLFVFAVGLALAYELTDSLLVPIAMHALFNGVMVAQLFMERMKS